MLFLSAILFFNASADSNETQMKFIKAGLVDVKSIDQLNSGRPCKFRSRKELLS
jgi:hypothetical protein